MGDVLLVCEDAGLLDAFGLFVKVVVFVGSGEVGLVPVENDLVKVCSLTAMQR